MLLFTWLIKCEICRKRRPSHYYRVSSFPFRLQFHLLLLLLFLRVYGGRRSEQPQTTVVHLWQTYCFRKFCLARLCPPVGILWLWYLVYVCDLFFIFYQTNRLNMRNFPFIVFHIIIAHLVKLPSHFLAREGEIQDTFWGWFKFSYGVQPLYKDHFKLNQKWTWSNEAGNS